jgi:hypothetical protein
MKLSAHRQSRSPRRIVQQLRRRLVFFGSALVLGLVLSVIVFNLFERRKDRDLEVTFVDPHQAVVFWRTDHATIGYVMYGEHKNRRVHRAEQTSSTPGSIHAVLINDVPLEGLYFTIHNESDSPLYWPAVTQIHFDPTTIE